MAFAIRIWRSPDKMVGWGRRARARSARPGPMWRVLGVSITLTAAASAWATSNSVFFARAQSAFDHAESEFRSKPADTAAAWHFAKACFDLAEYATNQAERARLGERGSAACRQLLARTPDSAEGHYYLAMNLGQIARTRTLGALKLVNEMEREFKAAVRLDEKIDYAGPSRSLGMLYRDAPSFGSIGSRVKARQYLQRAIEVAPDYPENRIVMAESCVKWSDRNGLTREWKALEPLIPEARRRFSGVDWEAAWVDWDARLAELHQKTEAVSKTLRAPRES